MECGRYCIELFMVLSFYLLGLLCVMKEIFVCFELIVFFEFFEVVVFGFSDGL